MHKLTIAGNTMIALLLLLATTSSFADHSKEGQRGLLGNEMVFNAASHFLAFGGDDRNAGVIASSEGNIEGIGQATVDVSSSWDWGLFNSDHPCALNNITSHTFLVTNAPGPGPFTTLATVTITAKNGDQINGFVRGGSVCEIIGTIPAVCTVNEGVTTFDILGGTGKFASASGSGILRSVFSFCTGVFLLDEIILHLNK